MRPSKKRIAFCSARENFFINENNDITGQWMVSLFLFLDTTLPFLP